MNTFATHSVHLPMLDAMILRAEAACERSRLSAEVAGLLPHTARWRRQSVRQMEQTLSRLREQRREFMP